MFTPQLPPEAAPGLYLLAVATPESQQRERARQIVRQALREKLGKLLAVRSEEIELISRPGAPIRLAAPDTQIGLSLSHQSGLSLAAINLGGSVGVDLMRLDLPLSDIETLAHDYLGPAKARLIAGLATEQQALAFAQAWTQLEARLKCLGLPLSEWTPALESKLATCTSIALAVPDGWVASLATCSTAAS